MNEDGLCVRHHDLKSRWSRHEPGDGRKRGSIRGMRRNGNRRVIRHGNRRIRGTHLAAAGLRIGAAGTGALGRPDAIATRLWLRLERCERQAREHETEADAEEALHRYLITGAPEVGSPGCATHPKGLARTGSWLRSTEFPYGAWGQGFTLSTTPPSTAPEGRHSSDGQTVGQRLTRPSGVVPLPSGVGYVLVGCVPPWVVPTYGLFPTMGCFPLSFARGVLPAGWERRAEVAAYGT